MLECVPIGVLRLILRVSPIPQNTGCQAYTPMMMTFYQLTERLLIAVPGAFNQIRIVVFVS
jgi:hypothetical protein